MARATKTALFGLAMVMMSSEVCALRKRRSTVKAKSAQVAPVVPGSVAGSVADPASCSVPGWILDAMRVVLNTALELVLRQNDPWNLNFRDTNLEQDLWFCTLKVIASTDMKVTGLSTIQNTDFSCLESECLNSNWAGCSQYKHTLRTAIGIGPLTVNGTDESVWECGTALPQRRMGFSYELHDYGINAEFKVDQTVFPPNATITEVSNIDSVLGTPRNIQCNVQDVELGWMCEPMMEMMSSLIQDSLKPVIDRVLLELVNYLLASPEGAALAK